MFINLLTYSLITQSFRTVELYTISLIELFDCFFVLVKPFSVGRKYGIVGQRGNMVVKEFLVNNGVDITRFDNPFLKKDTVRRCTLKMPGLECQKFKIKYF